MPLFFEIYPREITGSMKIVLVGRGGLLTKIVLEVLIKSAYPPALVLIQDKKSAYPNLTMLLCEQYNIPYSLSTSVQTPACLTQLEEVQPDLIVVASLGEILKAAFLQNRMVWNVHMGILPDYKGPLTNFWLIKKGGDWFGCTIHEIDEGVDTGPILKTVEHNFTGQLQAFEFVQANYEMAASALLQTIQEWEVGNITPTRQDPEAGTYYPKFKQEDLQIDLRMKVDKLHKVINRLQFYGVPWIKWNENNYSVFASNRLISVANASQEVNFELVNRERAILKNSSGFLELVIQPIDDY